MHDSKQRLTVLRYVQALSDKQFVEFFYDAIRGRITSDVPRWRGHFVLADAEKVDGEDEWDIDFIGLNSI